MIARQVTKGRPQGPPKFGRGRLLRGSNVHHGTSVFHQPLEAGALAGLDSADAGGAAFGARFLERFGTLHAPSSDGCVAPDFRIRLEGGGPLPLVEVLLEAILAVERNAACASRRLEVPRFARVLPIAPGRYELVWEAYSASLSRLAARTALAGLLELLPDGLVPVAGEAGGGFDTLRARLSRRCRRRQWSIPMALLAFGARRRGVPAEALAGNYLRLGEGSAQHVVSESVLGVATAADPMQGRAPRTPAATAGAARPRFHRVLVVDGEVVSAVRIEPPTVTGDGVRTVAGLIEALNADAFRHDGGLRRVRTGRRMRQALEEAGWSLDAVPAPGDTITLESAETFERGGVPVAITDDLHRDARAFLVREGATHGRRPAGVTCLALDLTRPGRRSYGRVTSVRNQPDFLPHVLAEGADLEGLASAVLGLGIGADESGRIPIALVIGSRGTHAVAREVERHLRTSGSATALALRTGSTLLGKPVERAEAGHRVGPEFLLRDARVETLVMAIAPRRVVERGLRLDHTTLVAVLDPATGEDREQYLAGVRVAIAATTGLVVLGADNPEAGTLLEELDPTRVLLVGARPKGVLVTRHLADGGGVVRWSAEGQGNLAELRRAGELLATMDLPRPGGGSRKARARQLFTAALAMGFTLASGLRAATMERSDPERFGSPRT